jgi:hypothetical protein
MTRFAATLREPARRAFALLWLHLRVRYLTEEFFRELNFIAGEFFSKKISTNQNFSATIALCRS